MPDSRFFETLSPISVGDAVSIARAKLISGGAGGTLSRVAAHTERDIAGAVVYCGKPDFLKALQGRAFGLCLTTALLAPEAPQGGAIAAVASPRLAFALISGKLHRSRQNGAYQKHFGKHMMIDQNAMVAKDAILAEGVCIGPHSYIGPGVVIGEGTIIESGVSVSHALIGKNVHILAGARIGQAGFGFVETEDGLARVPQLGRVLIEDEAEIGANTTIDRGALEDTVIGQGTKIDNLVQIGHNTRIGRYCVLAAQTGISGSCIIGDGVFMGGKVGLADHLTVGDGAQIAAGSGLMHDVPPGEKWGGRPAKPAKEWLKEIATLTKLAKKKNRRTNGES